MSKVRMRSDEAPHDAPGLPASEECCDVRKLLLVSLLFLWCERASR